MAIQTEQVLSFYGFKVLSFYPGSEFFYGNIGRTHEESLSNENPNWHFFCVHSRFSRLKSLFLYGSKNRKPLQK